MRGLHSPLDMFKRRISPLYKYHAVLTIHRYTLIEQSNILIKIQVQGYLFLTNSMLFTLINQATTIFDHDMMRIDFLKFAT